MSLPNAFTLDVVSPERLLFSGQTGQAVLPGAEGVFGVLPGHMKLAAALVPGELSLFETDASAAPFKRFYVFGGFAEVTGDRVTVLAERAADLSEHTRETAAEKIASLKAQASASSSAADDLAFYEGLLSVL